MTMLTYILGLVITLLILYPFALFTSASIFSLYFKHKEEYVAKMAKRLGDGAMAVVKVMEAMKPKKTEEKTDEHS